MSGILALISTFSMLYVGDGEEYISSCYYYTMHSPEPFTEDCPFFTDDKVTATDPQCTFYNHATYGYGGQRQCITTSDCTALGGGSISNLCPTFPNDVKCCFTNDDPECTTYYESGYGLSGSCRSTSNCPGNNYISSKCPTKANDIKCCFSAVTNAPTCTGYNHPTLGSHGQRECIATSECTALGGTYISNLCPNYPNNVRCCFRDPCNEFTMVSRAEWGARDPVSTTSLTMPVDYVFIHHTTGGLCLTSSTCESRVRGIQDYHMDNRNYDDIGYSFLVGGDGKIYEGRGWGVNGAHTQGYNDKGFAFSFIGDFTSKLPSEASLKAAANAIACGVKEGYIKTGYTLRGHKDMPNASTACPGTRLHQLVKKWPHY